MKIIGLDISTSSTGYAIYGTKSKKWSFGNFKKPNKIKGISAMLCQAQKIKKLIDGEKPNIIVIEDTFMKNNFATVKLLNELRGWVIVECYFKNITTEIIMASSARRIVGINTTLPSYNKEIREAKKQYNLKSTKKNKSEIDRQKKLKNGNYAKRKKMIIKQLQDKGFKVDQNDQADAIVLVLATIKNKK